MFGIGRVISSIVYGIVSLYETILSHPKRAVWSVVGLAALLVAFWGGIWWGERRSSDQGGRVAYRKQKAPQNLSDLLREVAPNTVYVAENPDKSEVDTVRVMVPKYVTKTDTVYRWMDRAKGIFTETTPSVSIQADLASLDMGFLVLPLKNGNPTVRVTPDLTTIDTFNPRNAQNITLEYNHPEDWFDFGPYLATRYNYSDRLDTQVDFGIYSSFRNSLRIDLGLSSVPSKKKISPMVGVEVRYDITQNW